MILVLQTERLRTLDEVRAVIDGNQRVDFQIADRESAYDFIRRTLVRFHYLGLSKPDRGVIRRYLAKMTGLSRAQLTRLIRQYRDAGRIVDRRGKAPAKPFRRRYTPADIRRLAEVDATLGVMSGPATRAVMRREFEVFGDPRFERLARLSNGHLYNLRKSNTYRLKHTTFTRTRPVPIAIGERRKPEPQGQPGFLRVDTVHQGDRDGAKGVYHINTVDEVTQYEHIGSVEAISEGFLDPRARSPDHRLSLCHPGLSRRQRFPNTSTTRLPHCSTNSTSASSPSLEPGAPTTTPWPRAKTPPWCANISATPTSPGASRHRINDFNHNTLSPFLNYHRPCLYPTEIIDPKGRLRKRYRDADLATPYEKLKSLPNASGFLKPGVNFAQLDAQAYAISDLNAAKAVNRARKALFGNLTQARPEAA